MRHPVNPKRSAVCAEPVRTIVWFGNSGSKYGDFGIANLRIVETGLRAAAKIAPIRLLVISDDAEKFKAVTRDFPCPCFFLPWSRKLALDEIARADLCIVPNSRDRFSLGKSANRIVLALGVGVPVVASWVPAAEPLRPFVTFDDWEGGIVDILQCPKAAHAKAKAAQDFIRAHYSPDILAERWRERLAQAPPPLQPCHGGRRILVFIDAAEDIDVLAPLQADLLQSAGAKMTVGVTTEFARRTPRLIARTRALGAELRLFDRREVLKLKADARAFDAIIVLGDGRFESHAAHNLAGGAERNGPIVFALQRSLLQGAPGHPPWRPAASRILVWASPGPGLSERAVDRCIAVRRPLRRPRKATLKQFGPRERLVAVFENLHLGIFDEAARVSFTHNLMAAAHRRPEHRFVVRSHPSGRWLTRQCGMEWPTNVLLIDPDLPLWADLTSDDLIAAADRTITTPSTIALDAAQLGRSVAVTGAADPNGLDFAPLPRLETSEDWLVWIDHGSTPAADLKAFAARRLKKRAPTVGQRVAQVLADLTPTALT